MRHFPLMSRLIRKYGPAAYWIIMISYALVKFVNEALFYKWRTITNFVLK
jgi:hypothetical protein